MGEKPHSTFWRKSGFNYSFWWECRSRQCRSASTFSLLERLLLKVQCIRNRVQEFQFVEWIKWGSFISGLFHRAIVQSGTSLCPWGVSSVVGEYTKILANHLGCLLTPSRAMLTCLRTKSPEDIVGIRKHIIIDIVKKISFSWQFIDFKEFNASLA